MKTNLVDSLVVTELYLFTGNFGLSNILGVDLVTRAPPQHDLGCRGSPADALFLLAQQLAVAWGRKEKRHMTKLKELSKTTKVTFGAMSAVIFVLAAVPGAIEGVHAIQTLIGL